MSFGRAVMRAAVAWAFLITDVTQMSPAPIRIGSPIEGGVALGLAVGVALGLAVGVAVGSDVALLVGVAVGWAVGVAVPVAPPTGVRTSLGGLDDSRLARLIAVELRAINPKSTMPPGCTAEVPSTAVQAPAPKDPVVPTWAPMAGAFEFVRPASVQASPVLWTSKPTLEEELA